MSVVTFSKPDSELQKLWKKAAASGHEIGHPCTGNFAWTRYDGVGEEGSIRWSAKLGMLRELLAYTQDPTDGV